MAAQGYSYNQQQQNPHSGNVKSMNYQDDRFNFKKYASIGIIALVVIFVGGFLWNIINSPIIVTVTGTGEVSASVDSATVTFVVGSSSGTVSEAINSVESKKQNFINLLTSQGISEQDIAESQVNVVPSSTLVQGATGYQATITMGAKTVHVSKIENLINLLYSNGAALVSQPVVSTDKKDELEKQALDMAMKEAKSKASQIGTKNFKFIRKIVAISQSTPTGSSTVTSKSDDLLGNTDTQTLDTGAIKVRKTVTVSYKMW
jgi:uncharacterized protein YggE